MKMVKVKVLAPNLTILGQKRKKDETVYGVDAVTALRLQDTGVLKILDRVDSDLHKKSEADFEVLPGSVKVKVLKPINIRGRRRSKDEIIDGVDPLVADRLSKKEYGLGYVEKLHDSKVRSAPDKQLKSTRGVAKNKGPKHDWEAIKNDYESGVSLTFIESTYNIKPWVVKREAKKRNWKNPVNV